MKTALQILEYIDENVANVHSRNMFTYANNRKIRGSSSSRQTQRQRKYVIKTSHLSLKYILDWSEMEVAMTFF